MSLKRETKEVWVEQVSFYGSLDDAQEHLTFLKEKYKDRKVFFHYDQDRDLWLKEEILEPLSEYKKRIKKEKKDKLEKVKRELKLLSSLKKKYNK